MAKPTKNETPESTEIATAPKRPRVDRKLKERVNLLRSIAEKYKDQALALAAGDDAAFVGAGLIIDSYKKLFDQLSQESADAVTASGLAEVNEM